MKSRRALLWIIAAALLLRLGVLWYTLAHVGAAALSYGDASGSTGYIALASSLAHGYGFASQSAQGAILPEVFRTPGLPLLLSVFTLLPHGITIYGIFLSIIAGALLPLFTFFIGKRIAGERVGLIPAAL